MPNELAIEDLLAAASRRWAIDLSGFRPDLLLAGSPQRTAWRGVVESSAGHLFVLEKIPSRAFGRKRRIAATLQSLAEHGLNQVAVYLPDIDGDFLTLINEGSWHGLWQICPYTPGVKLNRPDYAFDGWRGDAAAEFLIRLFRICEGTEIDSAGEPVFSIAHYGIDLFDTLTDRHPDLASLYRPFMDHLKTHFFPVHDQLPTRFCHGDFHPLNILWDVSGIRLVIDWEFCGIKPELYDLANLLGCLGIEDPGSLKGPFAARLIHQLKKAEIFSPASWRALPELMLAIRFSWLSEWLRNDDHVMIKMEADYMALLLGSRYSALYRQAK